MDFFLFFIFFLVSIFVILGVGSDFFFFFDFLFSAFILSLFVSLLCFLLFGVFLSLGAFRFHEGLVSFFPIGIELFFGLEIVLCFVFLLFLLDSGQFEVERRISSSSKGFFQISEAFFFVCEVERLKLCFDHFHKDFVEFVEIVFAAIGEEFKGGVGQLAVLEGHYFDERIFLDGWKLQGLRFGFALVAHLLIYLIKYYCAIKIREYQGRLTVLRNYFQTSLSLLGWRQAFFLRMTLSRN